MARVDERSSTGSSLRDLALKIAAEERPRSDQAPAIAERWARVHAEAASLAPGPFGYLLWVDAKCISHGMPGLSAWWRYSTNEFYSSGKRWGVYDVGRGGGKSTSLERVAGTDSVFEPRKIFPGQTWTWPFISVGPDDANRRVDGIKVVYDVIGVRDDEGGELKPVKSPRAHLDLKDCRGNKIQLASLASTIGNVSGPSTIGVIIDEAAKLYDKSSHANPLTEIVASLAGTFRARQGPRGICCSSSMWREGAHFAMVMEGDTETNYVARIGEPFLEWALMGFESVAAWEQRRGDARSAAVIRTHAATLTANSPLVPTWVANPTLGNPDGAAWEGAALASRLEYQVIPIGSDRLEGLSHAMYWLRECGSLPMARELGADMSGQCFLAAEINERLARRFKGRRQAPGEVMKVPGARPGDARYAGPPPRFTGPATNWRTRKVM